MKKILLTILPLLLIVGCSKPINDETLIDKDGLKYHPETKELYSGETTKNRLGGNKEFDGIYKYGKKDGLWTYWSPDEQESSEIIYKDGNYWDGIYTSWFERGGRKEKKETYKDGKKDGLWTHWHTIGPWVVVINNEGKKEEGTYRNGKRDGLWTWWYDNGYIVEEKDFDYGNLINKKEYVYYSSGKVKTIEINDEMIIYYSVDGEIEKEMKNGEIWNGKLTLRFSDGQEKSVGTYKDGKLDGLLTEWDRYGQKKSEGTYRNGKEDGLFTEWYSNGQKYTEVTYKNEERHGLSTMWYKNGRKEKEGTYKGGDKDGLWTEWERYGQKVEEGTYKDGKLISSTKFEVSMTVEELFGP